MNPQDQTQGSDSQNDSRELKKFRKQLEKVYDCQFCDGKYKLWDNKRQKYIKCPHTETTDKLFNLITQRDLEQRIDELRKLYSENYQDIDNTPICNAIKRNITELERKLEASKGETP